MVKLYRREDSDYWYAEGRDRNGNRWKQSTRQRSRARARTVAVDIERQRVLSPAEAQKKAGLALVDALELLEKHKKRKKVAKATLDILAQKGGRLLVELGDRCDVTSLSLLDAEAYVDRRLVDGVSLHTIEKEWGTLRAALRQASRHGLYYGDPQAIWPDSLRDVYTPRDRWLTGEEYLAMLGALPSQWLDHFVVYCHTGVRYGELYTLTGSSVRTKDRSIFVEGTKGERDRARRIIPCTAAAWEVIERRRGKGLLFPDRWISVTMGRQLKEASADLDLPVVSSANDLRRTFATWCLHAHVPEATAQRLMGHSSSAMLRRVYAHHSPELLRDAIDRIERLSHICPSLVTRPRATGSK